MAESYFFNRKERFFVRSVEEPTRIDPPEWGYGDVKAITVTFVDPLPRGRVSVVVDPVSVQLGIGTPGGSVLTSATASTPSSASAYPFTVPLNIAAINTFLGSDTRKQTTLEFLITDSTGPNHYPTALFIRQQLLSTSVVDPAPPAVGISVETASGLFVPKSGVAGEARILRSPLGYRVLEYYGDDKQMHWDPID